MRHFQKLWTVEGAEGGEGRAADGPLERLPKVPDFVFGRGSGKRLFHSPILPPHRPASSHNQIQHHRSFIMRCLAWPVCW